MRKILFCYEFIHGETPIPVIYYDEIPQKNVKENNIRREKIVDVSHIPKQPDNELSISYLTRLFPYLTKETSVSTVKQQEKVKMVTPVTGFLSANGQFFPTKARAEFYDAAYALHNSVTDAVVGLGIKDETHIETLVKGFKDFVEEEIDLLSEFIRAQRALSAETNTETSMAGPATEVDTIVDTSLQQLHEDKEVDTSTTTETKSANTGKRNKSKQSLTDLGRV